MPKVKKFSKQFNSVLYTATKTNDLTKGQQMTLDMLKSFVSTGEISECQASYTIGILVASGGKGLKDYVEKCKNKINGNKEVEND